MKAFEEMIQISSSGAGAKKRENKTENKMANSDANYSKPIKWGNVKKIEVSRQFVEDLFYRFESIEDELEHLNVSINSISNEKNKEIKSLKAEIELLNKELQKYKEK